MTDKENLISEEVRSVRNNNPGNLRAVDRKTQQRLTQKGYVLDGAVGFDKDGFAIFPDKQTGMSAMQRQLRIDASRGMTGADMIKKYAPPTENDTDSYIYNVFTKSGINANDRIDPKNIDQIQRMMVKHEGGQRAYDQFYGSDLEAGRLAGTTKPDSTASPTEYISSQLFGGGKDEDKMKMGLRIVSKSYDKAFDLAKRLEKDPEGVRKQFRDDFGNLQATVSENTHVRFKDLRKNIQEQILMNERAEQIQETIGGAKSVLRSFKGAFKPKSTTKKVMPVEKVQSSTTRAATEKTPAAVIDIQKK